MEKLAEKRNIVINENTSINDITTYISQFLINNNIHIYKYPSDKNLIKNTEIELISTKGDKNDIKKMIVKI